MKEIPLLAPVALVVDLPEQQLTRGQMGTVVEYVHAGNEDALLVEFSDDGGRDLCTRRGSTRAACCPASSRDRGCIELIG